MDRSPDYEKLYKESERKRQEAERKEEEARRERERAERALREATDPTTFTEFIKYCHMYISEPLQIETNKERSTGAQLTSPKGRLCPTYLKPWDDFHQQQVVVYQRALEWLCSLENPRLFSSRTVLQGLGSQLCGRPQSSEADFWTYARLGMEDLVVKVLEALRPSPDFSLENGIQFDNHTNAFDDTSLLPETQKRKRSRPDQFCVHRKDAENTLLLIMEDKAGAKLTPENLRAGLHPTQVWDEVVQRPTIPLDRVEKLKYNAELLTNSALTHAYDSMMHRGLELGVLRTGSCLVFLYISEHEPETLRYFLAEPNLDVKAMINASDNMWMYTPVTAVGRLLAFCLMSLERPIRSQHWRNEKIPKLHTWEVDFQRILSQIPDDEIHSTPPGSEYIPSSSPMSSFSESHNPAPRAGCRPDDLERSSPTDDSESDDLSGNKSVRARKPAKRAFDFSSSPPQRQHRSGQQYKRNNRTAPAESLEFCTEKCLLGIKSAAPLDKNCPNVKLHRVDSHDYHSISCADLVRSLKQQLDNDLDNYCTPYGQPGDMEVPFKLTLTPYGYTFIGKGTADRGWEKLKREAEIYRVLKPAQGSAVPVFLGSIHPSQTYFYEDSKIKHFLLFSWCGDEFDWVKWNQEQWDIYRQTVREIHRFGVRLGKVHRSNVLWDPQRNQVRLVGFDQAKLVPKVHEKRTPMKRKIPAVSDTPRKRVHAS